MSKDQDPPDRPLNELDTIDLVERARDGEDRAKDELARRWSPRLRRWAHGRLTRGARGMLDTEDVVQETLFNTIRRIESFVPRHRNAFLGFVRRALKNRIIDANRGNHPEHDEYLSRPDVRCSPLQEAIGREKLAIYEQALEGLSSEDQMLIVARVEFDLGYEEIAELTDKPSRDAARMAVSRAKVRLAEKMAEDG